MNEKINILTRTSNRPKGFSICADSIVNQTYGNINHIVSYDDDKDLEYISKYENIKAIKIDREEIIKNDTSVDPKNPNFWFSPHNLYCNPLLDAVEEGWVMFLDDDDMLIDNDVIEEIVLNIKDEDTMLIWQMRYPTGNLLPDQYSFLNKQIRLGGIGSPCFLFHSKWKDEARWDAYKCGDFRFLEKIYNKVPKKSWIRKPFIQLNNNGGLGKKIDI
jgi:glycosyltransferase involved in cell wall biosynthesis